MRAQTALYAAVIFATGLAYRATFISQGFNASDEGFLPALALRVVKGQVVYRDFYYASPPLTLFKEAGIAALMGSSYGFLASRWVFAAEVSAGSVIAFLIVCRYTTPLKAFLVTLPTIFFTTVLYAYSNFNFDAQILFLAAFLILAWEQDRERPGLIVAAGALCGFAFLAKPTYLGMAVGICGLGLLRPLTGGPRRWPLFAAGFVLVVGAALLAVFAGGVWDQFRHQSFGQLLQARPVSRRQLLYQDWPKWLFETGHGIVAPLAAGALVALALKVRRLEPVAMAALALILVALVPPALPSSTAGIPTDGQMSLLVAGLALVLAINVFASVVTVVARVPGFSSRNWAKTVRDELFPPAVPIVAAVLEYLQGEDLSSMRFAYVGTFLGVPVALLFLSRACRLWGAGRISRVAAPAVAGSFLVLAGAVITHGSPYLDGPRSDMTAGFTAPGLAGIATVPSNANHVNSLVAEIKRDTAPAQPTLVFPDGQVYYVLTGRENPTKVDWYDILATTPAMTVEALDTLKLNPPEWVFVQQYNESDINHVSKLDFESQPAWQPIFDFVTSNYDLVRTVDGVDVYRLK